MDPGIFKAYDIRGTYPDQLDEESAWKIGCATARFLPSQVTGYEHSGVDSQTVCVGRDMRTHSEPLSRALVDGIRSTGMGVIDIGMIDTPQMYFAVNHVASCGGVQVTASHNPAEYNGFKICGMGAAPIAADTGLRDIQRLAMGLRYTMAKAIGPLRHQDLTADYRKHVLQFLRPDVRGRKVAIDASNGMAGKAVPAVFSDVPIDIVAINFEHKGIFQHNPDPLVERNLAELKSVTEEQRCDFGVCFDGDADRMMMVDEKGQTISCDLVTAVLVPYFLQTHPGAAIVYDLRSSRVVVEEIVKHGGTPRRERVGHAYMKKAMRDWNAIFGGELSGHFYFRDSFYAESALIALVHMLNILSQSDKPVDELMKPLRRYSGSGEINFTVHDKQAKLEELARRYSDGEIDYLDGVTVSFKEWWFNCRPSNTEPLLRLNVEAKTKEMLDDRLAEIADQLGKPV